LARSERSGGTQFGSSRYSLSATSKKRPRSFLPRPIRTTATDSAADELRAEGDGGVRTGRAAGGGAPARLSRSPRAPG
jgi:hypothetical protein